MLIVYASRYGQTRKICERIGSIAAADGVEVHLWEVSTLPRHVAPHSCDLVVLAGAVYFGRFSRPLTAFATEQRTNLAKARSVFVAVSNAASSAEGRPAALADARAFLGRTGWVADDIELVAGGEPYSRYGLFTRWVMRYYARKFGRTVEGRTDYEFTDWSKVDAFAHRLIGVETHDPALALM
jgi:menaquinone-dependent protoporphyrinogen oxidase